MASRQWPVTLASSIIAADGDLHRMKDGLPRPAVVPCSSAWRRDQGAARGWLSRTNWGLIFVVVCLRTANGASLVEDFSVEPGSHGWRSSGMTSLFRWNRTNQNLEVSWDSSQTNSFFFRRLGTILTKSDDFDFGFDLRLSDIHYGTSAGKTDTFEIAIGLFNSNNITNANYFRGSGHNSTYGVRNLVEFNYFPDAGFGATLSATVVSTNNRIKPAHNFPLEMTTGDQFRIVLSYTASNQTLRTTATKNGNPFGLSPGNSLTDLVLTSHPDFRVDALSVSSYSDAVQTGPLNFWGSVLAHGVIDNIMATFPAPPMGLLSLSRQSGPRAVELFARSNWVYTLEGSSNLSGWKSASITRPGGDSLLTLQDTNVGAGTIFYRVRAERP